LNSAATFPAPVSPNGVGAGSIGRLRRHWQRRRDLVLSESFDGHVGQPQSAMALLRAYFGALGLGRAARTVSPDASAPGSGDGGDNGGVDDDGDDDFMIENGAPPVSQSGFNFIVDSDDDLSVDNEFFDYDLADFGPHGDDVRWP